MEIKKEEAFILFLVILLVQAILFFNKHAEEYEEILYITYIVEVTIYLIMTYLNIDVSNSMQIELIIFILTII